MAMLNLLRATGSPKHALVFHRMQAHQHACIACTQAHTHARTNARTHARTHARTQPCLRFHELGGCQWGPLCDGAKT